MSGDLLELRLGEEEASWAGEGWGLGGGCSGVLVGVVGDGGGGDAVGLEEGEDVGFGEVEAECFEGDFEFVVVDVVVFV